MNERFGVTINFGKPEEIRVKTWTEVEQTVSNVLDAAEEIGELEFLEIYVHDFLLEKQVDMNNCFWYDYGNRKTKNN